MASTAIDDFGRHKDTRPSAILDDPDKYNLTLGVVAAALLACAKDQKNLSPFHRWNLNAYTNWNLAFIALRVLASQQQWDPFLLTNSVGILVGRWGGWPPWTPFFLRTLAANPTITFLLLSETAPSTTPLPANVEFWEWTVEALLLRLEQAVACNRPGQEDVHGTRARRGPR